MKPTERYVDEITIVIGAGFYLCRAGMFASVAGFFWAVLR